MPWPLDAWVLPAGREREPPLAYASWRHWSCGRRPGDRFIARPGEAGGLIGPLGVGQTADELALLDQKACDMCGITFFEFRNQGRLGCPHDYVHFEKELEPLIANIHGATQHTGRTPSRGAVGREPGGPAGRESLPEETEELTGVIGLRRGMKEAIACEDYEKARENRDAIRAIEERWLAAPAAVLLPAPPGAAAGGQPGPRTPPPESGTP